MKRSTIAKTFAIAALALGMAPTAKADDKGCTNASLKGAYGYTSTGFITVGPAPVGPFAEVGTQTFDGKGGTTATATLSANGNIFEITITGTYTVKPDCTGTFTLQVFPFNATTRLFFVLDDNGTEIRAIQTGGGSVETLIGRRQFPVGDLRNN